MRADAIVFGIAGALFGVIVGWVLGSQQTAREARGAAPAGQAAPAQQPAAAVPLDPARVKALEEAAGQNPKDVQARVQLGNMYFDAEQYPQAITWYEQAIALNPSDTNVSTDLGVAYYYTNQADRALTQFEHSLKTDPRHIKTLLNVGIVRAFGKSDFAGAGRAWQQVVDLAPGSSEAQAARKGLEGIKASGK
jgi:cytochrome c-type biogenesis protein CcmH/NrfG